MAGPKGSLSKRTGNKIHRRSLYVESKKQNSKDKLERNFRRKKEEANDPELRRRRLEKNKPLTIDRKRVFDTADDDSLGANVDLAQLFKRRRLAEVETGGPQDADPNAIQDGAQDDGDDDEVDSMLGSDDEGEEEDDEEEEEDDKDGDKSSNDLRRVIREDSTAPSIATTVDLTPESLVKKFPTLFSDDAPAEPKLLITTTLNSTIHKEAKMLTSFFPNSDYVPRSAHKYAHKYSVREIAKYASNRDYTAILILGEDQKKPKSLDIVHLPSGPTFSFSVSNWMDVKRLPGHGNPQDFHPELLLNGFVTPLGVLTARILMSLFPKNPEFQGRQVVTCHNQRSWKSKILLTSGIVGLRATEKSAVDADGKVMKGVEDVKAVIQEVGPARWTCKLRRVVKGIGRAGSGDGDDAVPWQWKAKMDVKRTQFQL
ncbi:anticodon-binding protein [Apiospora rasikravindrae]|uniref:Anticodon-binding protein n=1 Tax=Apiospora rasikravindrae TaxID=990691 RepID=A0ABR1UCB3_9PEZI